MKLYDEMANDIINIVKSASDYLSEEKLNQLKADLEQGGLNYIQQGANHTQNKFSALLRNNS
jgi:hypothetical protein|tara:strand:- start:345 stop:530 length:186 start_codon:yes stop_codon:yes gene_type:complete